MYVPSPTQLIVHSMPFSVSTYVLMTVSTNTILKNVLRKETWQPEHGKRKHLHGERNRGTGKKNEHKTDEELVPVGTTSRQTHMRTRTHKHINHVLRNWYYITSPKISCAMKLKRTHIKHTTKDT